MPGVVIGNGFRIEKSLGNSSLGRMYLGFQENMDRYVRVEILSGMVAADDETFGRFQREVRLTGELSHANILAAIDAGEDNGNFFLISQHREGETLAEVLERDGILSEQKALELLPPLISALETAWNKLKLLHRNIQPQTIVLTESQGPVLTDFGIAKSADNDSIQVTGTGFTVGTPTYMSPEQCQAENDLDFRSDMYGLGLVLYTCLTGGPPFSDSSPVFVMQQQIDAPHPPVQTANPKVSGACCELIDKMLAKSRTDRFGSWEELRQAVIRVSKGESAPVPATAPKKKVLTNTRSAAGKAEGQLTKRDVERMAAEMFKVSPAKKFTMYALSAIIPIGLFVGIAIYQNGESATKQAAHASASANTPVLPGNTALPAATSPSNAPSDALGEMYEYADAYWKNNPDNYQQALDKFAIVREQTQGSKYFLMAEDTMQKIRDERLARQAEVLRDLSKRSQALVAEQKIDQAIDLLRSYDGALASETAFDREAMWREIDAARRAIANQEASQQAEIAARLEKFHRETANLLLMGRQANASQVIDQAAAEPLLASASASIAVFRDLLDGTRKIDERITATFQPQIGQTLRVRLKGGDKVLEIKNVELGKFQGEQHIRNGETVGKIGINFSTSDLTPAEIIDRLASSESPQAALVAGIVAWRLGEKKRAREIFASVDYTPIGQVFVNAAR